MKYDLNENEALEFAEQERDYEVSQAFKDTVEEETQKVYRLHELPPVNPISYAHTFDDFTTDPKNATNHE